MKKSKLTRILVIIGVFAAVCGAYVWVFGNQTFDAVEARAMARRVPYLKELPVALPDSSVSRAPGNKLSYLGYEFEVPWNDIDEANTRTIGEDRVKVAFRSGNFVFLWRRPPHEFVDDMLSMQSAERETLRGVYGDGTLNSDYTFERLMLEMTPGDISPFPRKEQTRGRFSMLLLKLIYTPGIADSGIFKVSAGGFDGFQFGLPGNAHNRILIDLHSESDSLQFILGQQANGPTAITQADINRILQTLQKVPASSAAPNR